MAHIFAIEGGVELVTCRFIDCGSASFKNNILTILSTVDRQKKISALKLEVSPVKSEKFKISWLDLLR